MTGPTRRQLILGASSLVASSLININSGMSSQGQPIRKQIPGTGEEIPPIGMGSWITFNVGNDLKSRDHRTEVLRTFFKYGGGMIDSSPMYGSSEEVIGYALGKLKHPKEAFSATKVWTPLSFYGKRQITNSQNFWGVQKFDLFQVHNLVSWRTHLETLFQMKSEMKIRYVGVTTSHGMRHDELEEIMTTLPIDFVQLTYNVVDRKAEKRILPIAAERRIGVIVNRPFRRGVLFDRYASNRLPEWTKEFDCNNWAQFFLKFVVSNPAITCTIPATSQIPHMQENMGAGRGRLPTPELRNKMIRHIQNL